MAELKRSHLDDWKETWAPVREAKSLVIIILSIGSVQ